VVLLVAVVWSAPIRAASSRDLPAGAWAVYRDDDRLASVYAVARSGETLFVGGNFDRIAAATGPLVAASLETGGLDSSFAPRLFGDYVTEVNAIEPDAAGGFYVGGAFRFAGAVSCQHLVQVRAEGSVNPDWCPAPDGWVYGIVRSGDTLYLRGTFDRIGGKSRPGLAAVDALTGRVKPWNPQINGYVDAFAVGGKTVYLGGDFTKVNGEPRRGLAAVDARTARVLAWNPNRRR
jgi:hypothetical protein